jgi:transposase-like protein
MGRKAKYPFELKHQTVKDCISQKVSVNQKSKELGIHKRTIEEWISNYQSMGIKGLKTEPKNNHYPAEMKEAAVKDYMSGKYSQLDVCRKYKIRSHTQLISWVKKYNGHETIKSSGTGGSIVTKGRKTTFDERVEIVKACIEQQHNYNAIAERYQVSYQQVRSWTVKYEQSGVETLEDRRGHRKQEIKMTEVEKLKAQNKLLEAKNRRLSLENEFLKKLNELEGGGA